MAVLQLYKNEACTEIWQNIPIIELHPSRIGWGQTPAGTITLGGNTYKYFDTSMYLATALQDVPQITAAPFMSKYKTITPQQYYCKNGFSLYLGVTENSTIMSSYRYGTSALGFNEQTAGYSETSSPSYWAIGFIDPNDGTRYLGFTRVIIQSGTVWPDWVPPIACIESSFWESALRPPYDYGNTPDGDGGQGSGTIDGTGVHTSPTPSGHVPTGGRGLHIYRISPLGYNSVQDYLWGEGSTLAKTLWQKFMNHNHNPANCIVGCFQLPNIFMPARGAAAGVQLGGVNLPTNGTWTTPHLYIDTAVYSLGTISPPFKSWLDYAGVTCKIAIPFCGEIPVPVEKVWDKEVTVQYRCDTFNGNFSAIIKAGGNMIANVTGNAAYQIPIVAGDDGSLQRIGAAAAGVLGIVTAGSSAAAMTAAGTAAAGIAGAQYNTYCANSNTSGNAQSCINGVAYIEYIVPQTAKINAGTYNGAYGMPSCVSGTLSEFTGGYGEFDVSLQEVASVWNATPEEKDEIVKLLEGGVFV